MSIISRDEFPNRAFQLAYFIHRERKIALAIATHALNKLQLAATAQRALWRILDAEARRGHENQIQKTKKLLLSYSPPETFLLVPS
jgi:hypothetical protein